MLQPVILQQQHGATCYIATPTCYGRLHRNINTLQQVTLQQLHNSRGDTATSTCYGMTSPCCNRLHCNGYRLQQATMQRQVTVERKDVATGYTATSTC